MLTMPSKKVKAGSVLEISLNEPIQESEMDKEVSLFKISSDSQVFLPAMLKAIQAAKTDDKIDGISLKIERFYGGISQASDLRAALEDFKESGKFVYAYGNNASQVGYYLNSVADSLFQNPLGGSLVQGLSAEVMFFKNAGDKYGIDFQVIRYGEFKSAVEPYLRRDLSDENRLQMNELLGDIWTNVSGSIAKSRKLTNQQIQMVTDSLYAFVPEKGIKHRLYDKLIQESEYDDRLFTLLNLADEKRKTTKEVLDKHTVTLEDYTSLQEESSSKNKVAVLYASGTITEGDGFDGIQSQTYVKAIQDIAKDDKVKALVIRVNSPGGSANASEQILFEIAKLRKKMPVVVSFGDVAASGGYYIAQASDRIFAQPNTITGSIGVFGMIPNAEKLFNNIGIDMERVKTNANADQLKSLTTPLSDVAEKTMKESVVYIYERFVNHVATNRKMTFEQVDKIGEGRVWSGTKAKQIGLVDEFGTLQDAILYASKLAKVEDAYSTVSFPKRKESFEELMEKLQGKSVKATIAEELGSEGAQLFQEIKTMNQQKGIQMRLPFAIKIQ